MWWGATKAEIINSKRFTIPSAPCLVLSSGVQVLLSQWCVIVREEAGTVHGLERDIGPHPAEREHTPFG
jgi:hypothetical protein